jgi:hypothetical protein
MIKDYSDDKAMAEYGGNYILDWTRLLCSNVVTLTQIHENVSTIQQLNGNGTGFFR